MPRLAFKHKDYELSYYHSGEGVPLVLIHGFPLDHRMWSPQIEVLESSCHLIAPDLRGFGHSTMGSENESQGIGMADYAADVLSVLDKIGITEPAILCGFSMGGYVLWQCLQMFPQRIRGIVLCDTKATADSEEVSSGRIKMAEEIITGGVGPVAEAMLPKLLAASTLANRADIVSEVDSMMRRCSPAAIAAAQRGMARRPDVTANLPKIAVPALIIVGAEDPISPPQEMRQIADSIPNAEFVEVPAAAHMTTLENPSVVCESLQKFVSELSR